MPDDVTSFHDSFSLSASHSIAVAAVVLDGSSMTLPLAALASMLGAALIRPVANHHSIFRLHLVRDLSAHRGVSPRYRAGSKPTMHSLDADDDSVAGVDSICAVYIEADDSCMLPIYDEPDTMSGSRGDKATERFRLSLIAFPVLMPILALASYDIVVAAFHELAIVARNWYAVDGGTTELELLTPVINGIIQPAVAITAATLVASTLNSLRSRQVAIRACLNQEACDIRSLEVAICSLYPGAEGAATRQALLNSLRQYVNRLIMESRPRSVATDVSSTTDSELDAMQSYVYAQSSATQPGQRFEHYDPLKFALPHMFGTLNAHRSRRLAELQTSYPAIHWAILGALSGAILFDFLLESDSAALQFLNSFRLRLLFTILVGVIAAVSSLCADLNDPFRGNFRVSAAVDQLFVIRDALEIRVNEDERTGGEGHDIKC